MSDLTPFQTVGPFFEVLLRTRVPSCQLTDATEGERITIEGALYDGAGAPIPDGFIEIWQAGADGGVGGSHSHFHGYGWSATTPDGLFRFDTVRPGRIPAPSEGERLQAPHIAVSVMARGVLTRYVTRLYFADEPANETDPVLSLVPPPRRSTLIAGCIGPSTYRFDIHLQGPRETVFFDV